MRRSLKVGTLLWVVALALVSWTLSQMPLADIGSTLNQLTWTEWSAWAVVNIMVVLAGNARWFLLTRMVHSPIGFFHLLIIRQAGQTISFITPGPQFGGEPLQIYWLYKRTCMAIHSAILSLGVDRFFELWMNFLMLMLGVSLLMLLPALGNDRQTDNNWQQLLLLISGALLILSGLALYVVRQPALLSGILEKLSARWLSSPRLQAIDDHWQSLGSDLRLAISTQKPVLSAALLLSLGGWILIIVEMWLVLGFFDIQLSSSGLVLILVAMRLALLLPLPAGIGTLEASVFWSFQALALQVSAALGIIAVMRLRDVLVLSAGVMCVRALR